MVRRFCLVRSGVAISLASLALMSSGCGEQVGGIILEPDGAGGTKDSSTDGRGGTGGNAGTGATGGSGGTAGATDGAAKDGTSDIAKETGSDASPPPVCIFHTDPPPASFSSADDGGADAGTDGANGPPTDAGSTDTQNQDTTTTDANGPDAMPDVTISDAPTLGDVSADSNPNTDAPTGGGDAAGDRRDGAAEGGDGAIPTSITILTSPFLGPYLADSAGRTLYTFGNDQAGDCKNLPVPDCEADCAIAWPPFDAGKRTLPSTLDPLAFGSVLRPDGMSSITTYYGWPLYYYRSDTTGGVINGQGKSKTWHVATVNPANMMIMRHKTDPRYIADGNGFTLYVYDQDSAGTATTSPTSACTGACLTDHPPFLTNHINAVSSLDPNDLSLFVRPGMSQQQVAYKGVPLYLSSADMRSGDQNGVNTGWTVAAAP